MMIARLSGVSRCVSKLPAIACWWLMTLKPELPRQLPKWSLQRRLLPAAYVGYGPRVPSLGDSDGWRNYLRDPRVQRIGRLDKGFEKRAGQQRLLRPPLERADGLAGLMQVQEVEDIRQALSAVLGAESL